ncbi:MAG: M48 family metallopeptidase [Pseudobdellovibrionaceae bacterium]
MTATKKVKVDIYSNEEPLFLTALFISVLAWGGLLVATKGALLAVIPFLFLTYLFAQSGFVSHLRGTGALVSTDQFPKLHEAVEECAARVGLKKTPYVFVMHMNGMFNAFALSFLRRHYVVLLSDIVDALDDHPDALKFYIGHEMGHIHRNHTLWEAILTPALILPLLGAAYSRAREYTCDQFGRVCCDDVKSSRFGLAALAVGGKKYAELNEEAYLAQLKETKGFWMSFHELIANYPWLTKRYARVMGDKKFEAQIPRRNIFAYLFAMWIPRLSIMSLLVVYVLIIGATVAAEKNKQGFEGEAAQDYSQSYDPALQEQAPVTYEVGKVYDNGYGEFYEYLGGDASLEASWRLVDSPSPAQPQQ